MNWRADASQNLSKTFSKVAQFFDLGLLQNSKRIGGEANKNYSVSTSKGDYIFKIVLEHPLKDLTTENDYLNFLKNVHFPSPTYLTNPEGSFIFKDDTHVIMVMPKLQGKKAQQTKVIHEVVGQNLAILHKIPLVPLPVRNSWLNKNSLPKMITTINKNNEKLQSRVEEFNDAFRKLNHFFYNNLPQSIIHGDLEPPNCLLQDNKLIAFLDWEEVSIGASLLDLSYCVVRFCFKDDQFQSKLFKALMKGYSQERILISQEVSQLPDAIRYAALTLCAWRLLQFGIYHPDAELIELSKSYWKMDLENLQLPSF